jgi:hypothetical protein
MTDNPATTENELRVLNAIRYNYFNSAAEPVGHEVWSLQIEDSNRPSGLSGRTLSGVCASLARKGLVKTGGSGREQTIALTQAGYAATLQD